MSASVLSRLLFLVTPRSLRAFNYLNPLFDTEKLPDSIHNSLTTYITMHYNIDRGTFLSKYILEP